MSERRLPKRKMYDKSDCSIFISRKNEKNRKKSSMEMEIRRLRMEDMIEEEIRRRQGEPKREKVELGKRQLDVFAIMQVLPYIGDGQTMLNLILTTKKFKLINKRLRQNYYDLTTRLDQRLFEHVDTILITTPISLKPVYVQIKERGHPPRAHLEREYSEHEQTEMLERKTEEDKKIMRDILLSDERTIVGNEAAALEQMGMVEEMSVHDIGMVLAPTFKTFTNIKIRVDFDWIVDYDEQISNTEYQMLLDLEQFMIKHDERGYAKKLRFLDENILNERVVVPEDWKILPAEVFQGFLFRELILSPRLFLIGDSAIALCQFLERICIPASVQIIRSHAFSGSTNLQEVIFERGSQLKIIGIGAFNSTKIERMELPEEVKQVGMNCFAGCKELTYVRFPRNIELIREPFYDNPQLDLVEIPVEMRVLIENEEHLNQIGKIPETAQVVYY